jgi:glycosyltransferase involved in cell wall biosynthesis
MPVYNHVGYVEEAIASVFAQSYRPIEFIIIDDGSSDGSPVAIEAYLAKNPPPDGVTVRFAARENRGAHTTINEGLALAEGEYLAILNSDDAYVPVRLERCVGEARRQRARLVFSHVEPMDCEGRPLPQGHPWRQWYADVLLWELDVSPSISSLLLTYNVGISTGNFVFHRSLFKQIGPFAPYRYAHDVDFLLRACLTDEPVIVREKLYRYRLHGSNTISENDDKIQDEYADIVHHYFERTLQGAPTTRWRRASTTGPIRSSRRPGRGICRKGSIGCWKAGQPTHRVKCSDNLLKWLSLQAQQVAMGMLRWSRTNLAIPAPPSCCAMSPRRCTVRGCRQRCSASVPGRSLATSRP